MIVQVQFLLEWKHFELDSQLHDGLLFFLNALDQVLVAKLHIECMVKGREKAFFNVNNNWIMNAQTHTSSSFPCHFSAATFFASSPSSPYNEK